MKSTIRDLFWRRELYQCELMKQLRTWLRGCSKRNTNCTRLQFLRCVRIASFGVKTECRSFGSRGTRQSTCDYMNNSVKGLYYLSVDDAPQVDDIDYTVQIVPSLLIRMLDS